MAEIVACFRAMLSRDPRWLSASNGGVCSVVDFSAAGDHGAVGFAKVRRSLMRGGVWLGDLLRVLVLRDPHLAPI